MKQSQKITPNLWFDHVAEEAVNFYVSIFPGSVVRSTSRYPDSAEQGLEDFQLDLAGKVLSIEFTLAGHHFTAINAGPEFLPTASSSFMVNFDPSQDDHAPEHIDEVWNKLAEGGEVLMPLAEYPFSKRYGWVQDKYGYSWQLILTNPDGDERPCIIPSLMFGGPVQGRAREAREYYLEVFKNSQDGMLAEYPEATGPAKAGDVMFSDFQIEGEWFTAMDSSVSQDFSFTEAVSYVVTCNDQEEIDYYWSKLSSGSELEQCGWCKDKFGVSWQIVPANMDELLKRPDGFKILMNQKKIVISEY
jgi:predicted 3-demethylubiquinone-9 3-methyltransferase (glyoxalase superfamily)